MPESQVGQILEDYQKADLTPELLAIVEYALKLTLTPGRMGAEDVERLRAVGYTDQQIVAVNLVASYFNFINRVADGLGVDLEPWMKDCAPLPPFEP